MTTEELKGSVTDARINTTDRDFNPDGVVLTYTQTNSAGKYKQITDVMVYNDNRWLTQSTSTQVLRTKGSDITKNTYSHFASSGEPGKQVIVVTPDGGSVIFSV